MITFYPRDIGRWRDDNGTVIASTQHNNIEALTEYLKNNCARINVLKHLLQFGQEEFKPSSKGVRRPVICWTVIGLIVE